ncbi:unnamed protein product [Caenorhabditis brenneri]
MDFSTGSSYYWNPSTYYWDPNPFLTNPYYPNEASHWNVLPFVPPTPNYSYPFLTTGYYAQPYSTLNQSSYDSYVNYFTPNFIPNYTPFYDQAQFPGTIPMPPPPMPTAASTTLTPPAPLPMSAAPPTPTVPAVQMKKELTPVVQPVNVKEEPVEDIPRRCSNCNTTDALKWRSAVSKDNILCKTCFDYRRTHKENRPTLKTHVNKEMKTIKTE